MSILFTIIFIIVTPSNFVYELRFGIYKNIFTLKKSTVETSDIELHGHSTETADPTPEGSLDAFLHFDWLCHMLHAFHDFHHRSKQDRVGEYHQQREYYIT